MVDSSLFKVMNGTGFRINMTFFLFMLQKFREVSFSFSSSYFLLSIAKPCISERYCRPLQVCSILIHWRVAKLANKAFEAEALLDLYYFMLSKVSC